MFEPLSHEQLAAVGAAMEEVSYDAGEYVFAHGDASDAFYVIVLGEAHVMCSSVGSPRPFNTRRGRDASA